MNIHTKIKADRPNLHQPAEPARRRFTSAELLAMDEAGVLHPEERVELIDGEIITMPAKSARHDDMCAALVLHFADHRPTDVAFTMEPAFRLSEHWEPEPDILLFPSRMKVSDVRGPDALLVVEVAVTSLSSDLKIKAPMYAAHGVREYWVVDAKRLVTHVHREPGADGYGSVSQLAATDRLEPLLLPALALTLGDLGLEPLADDAEGDPEYDGV